MSRIGKIPIALPKEVKVNIEPSRIHLEGPKGKLELRIPDGIKVELKEERLWVHMAEKTKQNSTNHGTIRARLANMVTGVTQGHKKELEIQGIGFRAQAQGKKIVFNLGFSHPVEYDLPQELNVTVTNQTAIMVQGIDNELVGRIAAEIKALKPVEPYKGKGIRFAGEIVRKKQGKSVTK